MVLIGLVLLAAAAVFGIDIAAQNLASLDVDLFGQTFATTPAAVFGLMMVRDGTIRLRRRRATVRETAAERDRLAAAYVAEHQVEPERDNRDDVDLRERPRDREQVSAF